MTVTPFRPFLEWTKISEVLQISSYKDFVFSRYEKDETILYGIAKSIPGSNKPVLLWGGIYEDTFNNLLVWIGTFGMMPTNPDESIWEAIKEYQ